MFAYDTQELWVLVNGQEAFAGYVHTAAAAASIVVRSPILDVGSPRTLALAKECLDKCAGSHEHCIKLSGSLDSPLPTRLLDCANPDRPCLVQTGGQRGRYLALSYVWGEDQPHKTTKANISAYANGIDTSSLPKTLLDAIRVTRALGFQYLWLDTLCIIQDSAKDKRHELAHMHLTYLHAHLTIIAASARKVSEGFLQDRPPATENLSGGAFPPDVAVPYICPPRSGHSSDNAVGHIRIAPAFSYWQEYVKQHSHAWEPIGERGWCMQEYFLSRRALIFTSHTLQYRCHTEIKNLGGAFYDLARERRIPNALFLPDPQPTSASEPPYDTEWFTAHQSWLELIEDYSQRKVTVSTDKLVACSAIAAQFHCLLPSEYIAGLWRDTLLTELIWYRREGTEAPRPTEYRAPSWSWASVDGGVVLTAPKLFRHIPGRYESEVADVVRCEVALRDASLPFGEVTGATLVLRAAVMPCALLDKEVDTGKYRVLLQFPQQARPDTSGAASVEVDGNMEHVAEAYIDCEADAGIQRTLIVPIVVDKDLQRRQHMAGLVVAPAGSGLGAESAGREVYRRIEFFQFPSEMVERQGRDVELQGYGVISSVEIELV
ncbi:hypothetical protein VTO73DRAFT_5560 [Trametes versicolor]